LTFTDEPHVTAFIVLSAHPGGVPVGQPVQVPHRQNGPVQEQNLGVGVIKRFFIRRRFSRQISWVCLFPKLLSSLVLYLPERGEAC